MNNIRESLWIERYSPKNIDDFVLPENDKKFFQEIIDKKIIPNLMLFGKPGTGKTTIAKTIVKLLDADLLFLNGSADRGIDVIKNDIEKFTSKISLKSGMPKIVIIDEANLTGAAYDALRAYIERSYSNARFIITTNYPNTIPDPVLSRFGAKIEFGTDKSILKIFAKRLAYIWENETKKSLTKDEKIILSHFAKKMFPDLRKAIIVLQQQYLKCNALTDALLAVSGETQWFTDYYKALKIFDFDQIRSLMQGITDAESIFSQLYNDLDIVFKPESIPDAVLIIAKYQYESKFSYNLSICLSAMSVELRQLKYV